MSTKQSHGLISGRAVGPKRVAICVPSGDMVHADFAMSLAGMTFVCSAYKVGDRLYDAIPIAIINTKGSLVVNNRNKLIEEARGLGVDYVLFVDSDIVLHPHALRRLLAHDKDIVGATYIQREEPHRLLGKMKDGETIHDALVTGYQVDTTQLQEVSALPGGCLLIKLSVFDGLSKPYFQTPAHVEPDGTPWVEGEDYFFCRQARAAGHSIWLDWQLSVSLSHIGQTRNTIPAVRKEPEPEAEHAIVY